MKLCAECNRTFESREPYHKYCQALPAEPTATPAAADLAELLAAGVYHA